MKELDAVVFDMDGVIFDSERCVLECWKELAEKYGIRDMEKHFRECIGTNAVRTREIMTEAFGAAFSYDDFAKEASVSFHAKYDNGKLPLKPGIFQLLDHLKDNGKKIALATSTRRASVLHQLEHAGLLDYFDTIITGDMVKRSKPDPEIYLLACEGIGVLPERAYAIEDSYNGVRSAHAGGLKVIMVPDLLPANDEMQALAEIILKDLDQVYGYLE
ncbi:MAG: HAD family phosphatase [Lachnospiraceae bacterium]|nr:HAD family phosphatase [Lachnospiraceae bacterium]